jgi:hypothetical protein
MGFFADFKAGYQKERNRFKAVRAEKTAADAEKRAADRKDFLAAVSYDEQFGVALAAPFRVSVFLDWTILDGSAEDADKLFPKRLYSISTPNLVDDTNTKQLCLMIARNFDVQDEGSALRAIGHFFHCGKIASATEFPQNEYGDYWSRELSEIIYGLPGDMEVRRKDLLTLIVCISAFVITASADCGFLEAPSALPMLSELRAFTGRLYGGGGSWEEYGERFLRANAPDNELPKSFYVDLQYHFVRNRMKALRKYVDNLCKRPGSPWRNVPFIRPDERTKNAPGKEIKNAK